MILMSVVKWFMNGGICYLKFYAMNSLSYVEEPLSWGDEEWALAIYEEVFDFYRD